MFQSVSFYTELLHKGQVLSTATADLKCRCAAQRTTHSQEAARLDMPLERRTDRVVHQHELEAIQYHVRGRGSREVNPPGDPTR